MIEEPRVKENEAHSPDNPECEDKAAEQLISEERDSFCVAVSMKYIPSIIEHAISHAAEPATTILLPAQATNLLCSVVQRMCVRCFRSTFFLTTIARITTIIQSVIYVCAFVLFTLQNLQWSRTV